MAMYGTAAISLAVSSSSSRTSFWLRCNEWLYIPIHWRRSEETIMKIAGAYWRGNFSSRKWAEEGIAFEEIQRRGSWSK